MVNVLFVSPHPDDVEFACFGTLLKHKENEDNIIYFSVSECSDLPRNRSLPGECRKVMKIISPSTEVRLKLPNRRIHDTMNREILRAALEDLRDNMKIDIVYSPWLGDINQDHRTTAEEVVRVFRYGTILQYEITHSCPGFTPNYYEEISEAQKNRKLEVIKIFKSQTGKNYATPRWIESVMLFRGLESGSKYAESFMVWRINRRL
ncbi:MAG: PIG-L family deacetylase [Thermoplasmata archaeon]|nr:PIG-L family deacetylase [Thermoplasmata archaeon]